MLRSRLSPVASLTAALIAMLAFVAPCVQAQVRFHVDPSVPASGDGLSWSTAYKGIKSAVTAAVANPAVTEIWVKAGTYYPGATPYGSRSGLAIYGGFAGTETSLAQRNLAANETILTGQDSVRVISGAGLGPTAVFDGFTIRDGRTNADGALIDGGSATFRRCKFLSSRAGGEGGVYASYGDSPTFIDCRFNGNESGQGGSVAYSYEGTMTFVNCRVLANVADCGGTILPYEGA
ncbi:MAG: right-handed parallel beta-helix repeat-containing protein, partial [Phycisphaerales bacterium]